MSNYTGAARVQQDGIPPTRSTAKACQPANPAAVTSRTSGRPEPPTITISLSILNMYEYYDDVVTTVTDAHVPAPPARADSPDDDAYETELADWARDVLFDFTGVGHHDGGSWYEVTVTDGSAPWLRGRTFDFGF